MSTEQEQKEALAEMLTRYDHQLQDDKMRSQIAQVVITLPLKVADWLADNVILTDVVKKLQGHTFYLDEGAKFIIVLNVDHLSDKTAKYVIAHEFAHAYLGHGREEYVKDKEQQADRLAKEWGYSK